MCCENRRDDEGVKIARLLLDHGAKLEHKNDDGSTALHLTCRFGSAAMVQLLLDHGANVERKDKEGRTALHWACRLGSAVIVQLLLDRKANVNAVHNKGCAPLIWACLNRFEGEAVIPILIAAGADLSSMDNQGLTSLPYSYHTN